MSPLIAFFRRLRRIPQGITIVTAAFLPIFAIVSMFPAVPAIVDHFAADPGAKWKVPMMVSAPGLTIALVAPFAGYFVDRFGRRPLLLGATLLYGVFGCAPWFLSSLDAVFISRLLLGFSEAAILTIVNTLIGDYWDDTGRRDWLFLQGVVGPLLSAGVILLSGFASGARWNGIFLIYAVAFPIFLAMLAFLYEPKGDASAALGVEPEPVAETAAMASEAQPAGAPAGPFPLAAMALVGVTTLAASALYYVFIISGSLAFREVGVMSPQAIGKITALPSLAVVVGALIFRLLSGRSNGVQLGTFFAMIGIGLAGIGLAPSIGWMIAALVLQQAGAGMAVPALIAWTQTKLPFAHRGRGMGIWTACFFFGQFSSPWLVHQANLGTGTMQGAFLIMGVLGTIVAVIAFVSAPRGRRPSPLFNETLA